MRSDSCSVAIDCDRNRGRVGTKLGTVNLSAIALVPVLIWQVCRLGREQIVKKLGGHPIFYRFDYGVGV